MCVLEIVIILGERNNNSNSQEGETVVNQMVAHFVCFFVFVCFFLCVGAVAEMILSSTSAKWSTSGGGGGGGGVEFVFNEMDKQHTYWCPTALHN